MNHITTIRLAVAVAASMMIAGIIFSPLLQQNGYSSSGFRHQIKALEHRSASQHMDQENLCLRADKCNNSNVGEQTIGNDNSVTGFADQSKNEQSAEVTPTPTPTVTPTPTPIVTVTPTPGAPGI
jgi:hypothetical protein